MPVPTENPVRQAQRTFDNKFLNKIVKGATENISDLTFSLNGLSCFCLLGYLPLADPEAGKEGHMESAVARAYNVSLRA